ncbi:MAG: dihydropyrimidinase [Bacteroidales bacterium]|nr:dihydropyrimidinase [Bacteroidales bacterium]
MSSILIKNGTIVTARKTFKNDLLLDNSKIIAIESNIEKPNIDTKIIDASSMYVFPGAIDPHVHLELPTTAGNSSDDFKTGSIAAIAGGTTSIIDFVTPEKGESLCEALIKRKEIAKKSLIDYGLHVSPTWWGRGTAEEMLHCIREEGITSFKTYMAYKDTIGINDDILLNVMETARNSNALVTIHCENGDIIEKLRNNFIATGRTSPEYHPASRPVEAEAEAVNRAIILSGIVQCPIYIVHVSTKDSIELIFKAQVEGQKVFAETCPQYLLLNDSVYNNTFEKSAPYVLSPPLRSEKHITALWDALKNGVIQTIGTDHCPFNLKGQKDIGKDDFTKIPNGVGGIEHRLSLLFTFGVLENKISINQFVSLVATQPAHIFGLAHQKGDIKVGLDADIVIWNPAKENIISVRTHYQRCDTNIYEGIKVKGLPEIVIVNGNIAYESGNLTTSGIKGKYLYRRIIEY